MITNYTEGNVAKQLVRFAFPLMLANILQTAYNLVDTIVIGQFVGATGITAVSTGGLVTELVTFFGTGVATAGQIIISQYVGKNDRKSVSRTVGSLFTVVLSLSLALTVVCVVLARPVVRWMNVPAEAASQTFDYLLVCFCGTFFIYGYNLVSCILRGMGDSKRPMVFIAIASVVNLVLDILFVAVFHWDAFGTALATVIGQAVSFVIALVHLYKNREKFGFDFKRESFRPEAAIIRPVLKIGLPMGLQNVAISFSLTFVSAFINACGVAAAAVSGVGSKLINISNIACVSMNSACTTFVGQNIAARKTKRVKQIIRVVFVISVAVALLLSVVVALFCEPLFSLFTRDPEVLAMSHLYILPFALGALSMASMGPFVGLVYGIGFAALSFSMAIVDSVIARIGLSLLFGKTLGMGVQGYWIGLQAAGFTTTIIGSVYYFSGLWKTRKLAIQETPEGSSAPAEE